MRLRKVVHLKFYNTLLYSRIIKPSPPLPPLPCVLLSTPPPPPPAPKVPFPPSELAFIEYGIHMLSYKGAVMLVPPQPGLIGPAVMLKPSLD